VGAELLDRTGERLDVGVGEVAGEVLPPPLETPPDMERLRRSASATG
jgi:hypothetical protein